MRQRQGGVPRCIHCLYVAGRYGFQSVILAKKDELIVK